MVTIHVQFGRSLCELFYQSENLNFRDTHLSVWLVIFLTHNNYGLVIISEIVADAMEQKYFGTKIKQNPQIQ